MAFPSVKIRCVGGEATQCAAQPVMLELALLVMLPEEVRAGIFDVSNAGKKALPVNTTEERHKLTNLLAAFSLGACSGVAAHNSFLMEQAKL